MTDRLTDYLGEAQRNRQVLVLETGRLASLEETNLLLRSLQVAI